MKIIRLIRRFVSLECNGSVSHKSQNHLKKHEPVKVIKFEDCEKINQRFASDIMEELNAKNQYLAAMAGWLTQGS